MLVEISRVVFFWQWVKRLLLSHRHIYFFIHSASIVVLAGEMEWSLLESNPVLSSFSSFMQLFVILLTVACHTMCRTSNNTKANPIVHFISIFTAARCKGTLHSRDVARMSLSFSARLSSCLRDDVASVAAFYPPSFPSLKCDHSWRKQPLSALQEVEQTSPI